MFRSYLIAALRITLRFNAVIYLSPVIGHRLLATDSGTRVGLCCHGLHAPVQYELEGISSLGHGQRKQQVLLNVLVSFVFSLDVFEIFEGNSNLFTLKYNIALKLYRP